MRILHTSDWHLGQHFIGKSRQNEHQKFISWLIDKVEGYQIDAVVIAGDIFDTGTPPSYARELYNQFVVEINKLNCRAVILAGNHDSVATLSESKALLAYMNTDVVANVSEQPEHQVILLNDRKDQPGAIICAVPFVRPRDVISSQAGQSAIDKSQELGKAIYEHYQQLFKIAEDQQKFIEKETGKKLPIIATGHLTAMGVKTTESVRDIYIGTLEAFPANHFPQADYIALGHIHRPQTVAKSEHIRYCGSPIPLSFDELKWQKQVLMVEFSELDTVPEITSLPIPLFQPMALLKGNLQQIAAQLDQLDDNEQTVWLSVEVETDDYLSDLQNRVESLVAESNVEVLLLKRARNQRKQQIERKQKETLAELNPFEVFERRLAQEQFESDEQQERLQVIRQNFAEITTEVAEEQGITLSKYIAESEPESALVSEPEKQTTQPAVQEPDAHPDAEESIAQEGLFGFEKGRTEQEALPTHKPEKKFATKKPAPDKASMVDEAVHSVDQTDLFAMFDTDQEGQP
ncbi:exonuclease subunit SbcD [Neptuniibacter caesariensis]|uniref:Nuclease SbcCD subunit D n=1 Tax=Neptuniibacter caesariensis TaxID=207954 RepID=A0A7U8C5D7_NEPCE|nr:exonuclease subunit SbcD [Neptuniibacter caesariensis]EAR60624.1 exonuclease SbcD [Oceanospirillum sp. MED92] [Neptuniibacter caesariensis]